MHFTASRQRLKLEYRFFMQISKNASLKSHNSFGIDVDCRYLVKLHNIQDIDEVLAAKQFRNIPRLILGGGSNVLFRKNYDGLVILVSNAGIQLLDEDEQNFYIQASAGENWHHFVQHCLQHGWAGLENLSLIPGTVGAAPMQNIGAYGVELSDRFHALSAIDLSTSERLSFDRKACQFGYRDSLFKRQRGRYLITDITVKLARQPEWTLDYAGIRESLKESEPVTAIAISDAVCRLRRSKLPDPEVLGNAGSFFKNPVVSQQLHKQLSDRYPDIPAWPAEQSRYKLSAAWLIEQCGWKGKRREDAGLYDKHALILVNYGHASGAALWQLAESVMHSVEDRFGISLEPEPLIL